ncbi:MAG: NUDIX domain-containing protein [Acidobacteriota bacterium]
MPKLSAGLLMYRCGAAGLEVFLVHPGGPFWKNKDRGAWSIPKGEVSEGEDLLKRARVEFEEEIGQSPPADPAVYSDLGEIKQKSGKIVHAWAFEGDWNGELRCGTFAKIEWPPRSGKMLRVPEVDIAGFFPPDQAKEKINPAQVELIARLEKLTSGRRRRSLTKRS